MPPSPDLLVIGAELNARYGNHDAAQEGFLAAWRLGLPVMSSGLGYLIDRLRFYDQASAPGTDNGALQASLTAAQRVSLRCDFNLVFTNYTGSSPAHPDDKVHERDEDGGEHATRIF
jgi:hypothetical protein